MGNPLEGLGWRLDNERYQEFPDIDTLDLKAISAGKDPGIYSIIGPNHTCAFLTVYGDNQDPQVWGLDYDPEYLRRATNLQYLGTITLREERNDVVP